MASADITVRVAAEVVVRESDGQTLLLTECWCSDRDKPIALSVIARSEDA